jgi:hypothetical protein
MAAGANAKKPVGLMQIKILKKDIRHVGIVVLPRYGSAEFERLLAV